MPLLDQISLSILWRQVNQARCFVVRGVKTVDAWKHHT